MLRSFRCLILLPLTIAPAGIGQSAAPAPAATPTAPAAANPVSDDETKSRTAAVVTGAKKQIGVTKSYDPEYTVIPYPGGDVPLEKGVCTDVVVRAFRAAGIDFQQLMHEDMKIAFVRYPTLWALKAPDPNIDHRRVPNFMVFFHRQNKRRPTTKDPTHYPPGDVVAWKLPSGQLHIGVVSDEKSPQGVPLVIHNIGNGTQQEDVLFAWEMIGHYRWW